MEHERQLKAAAEGKARKAMEGRVQARLLRNKANKRARLSAEKQMRLEKKIKALKGGQWGAKAARTKLPTAVQQRLEDAEADTARAEERAEALEDVVAGLEEHIEVIRRAIGKGENGEPNGNLMPDKALMEAAVEAAQAAAEEAARHGCKKAKRKRGEKAAAPQQQALWEMLGKAGEACSQPIIELGLTLMSNQLTAPQAVSVMRAFLRTEYPEKEEDADYRIPDAARFREWRRYLEPISHYMAVSVINLAKRMHVMHDATTKNHVHVFQTSFRCEVEGEDGSITVVDVPLKFEICPSSYAAAEAGQMYEAMSCDVADKPRVSGVKIASSSSDGAARSTSVAFADLRAKELERVQAFIDEELAERPEELQAAVDAYLSLDEEQREQAEKMHVLGCSGHALNLVTEDSHKQSEKKAVMANMAEERAARIIQRAFALKVVVGNGSFVERLAKMTGLWLRGSRFVAACDGGGNTGLDSKDMTILPVDRHLDGKAELPDVPNVINCASKAFASAGKHWDYYLNENRKLVKYAKDKQLPLLRLPAVQGSRQCINVQLATSILANSSTYLSYMDAVRVEADPNRLLATVWDGLRDRFVVAALRARSFVDVTYTMPMTFFTHSSTVTRPMLRRSQHLLLLLGGLWGKMIHHIHSCWTSCAS